jgi:hypothetical protein
VPEPTGNDEITLSQVGTRLVAVAGSGSKDYLLNSASGTVISSLPVKPSAGQPQPCSVNGQPAVAVVENGAIGVLSSDPADSRTIPIPPGKRVAVAVASTVAYVRYTCSRLLTGRATAGSAASISIARRCPSKTASEVMRGATASPIR